MGWNTVNTPVAVLGSTNHPGKIGNLSFVTGFSKVLPMSSLPKNSRFTSIFLSCSFSFSAASLLIIQHSPLTELQRSGVWVYPDVSYAVDGFWSESCGWQNCAIFKFVFY
jgi:hypothetical protein